jgi:hypothetical protein
VIGLPLLPDVDVLSAQPVEQRLCVWYAQSTLGLLDQLFQE